MFDRRCLTDNQGKFQTTRSKAFDSKHIIIDWDYEKNNLETTYNLNFAVEFDLIVSELVQIKMRIIWACAGRGVRGLFN